MNLPSDKHKIPIPVILLSLLIACSNDGTTNNSALSAGQNQSAEIQKNEPTIVLKDLFADNFKIGTALSREQIIGKDTNILPFAVS